MANINDFWELVKVAGGGTSTELTRVLDSIVRSDRAKIDEYFSNVIDQLSFDTRDWKRLRSFFIDIYSAHRAITTQASKISDPSNLSNSELDELFRSFGYPESTILRDFDNNPLVTKLALFLSLVDLYKIKGTPRSILESLQFYGITQLDIYEFWLQKLDQRSLFFKGDVIVGTSVNPDSLAIDFDLMTQGDPHWLLNESQILNLDKINDINLPSKAPYFAVVPIVQFGSETSMLIRSVHDQYETWKATGVLPEQNAEITILGTVVSLLELYLACVYEFQKLWNVGYKGDRYICYDGDSTGSIAITAEYESIIAPPITRTNTPVKLLQYYNKFTRETPRHFLQNKSDAGVILNEINPAFKSEIDNLTYPNTEVLESLLKDLGIWVRNNIGFGFVNSGYITFGLKNLFNDLNGVIDFFKPYRARLILLEKLVFDIRLFNSIRIDDDTIFPSPDPGEYIFFRDILTANSAPCCSNDFPIDATSDICFETGVELPECSRQYEDATGIVNVTGMWVRDTTYAVNDIVMGTKGNYDYICTKANTAVSRNQPGTGDDWQLFWKLHSQLVCADSTGNSFYSRNTYDCGSYHDIGPVTDMRRVHHNHGDEEPIENDFHIDMTQRIDDRLRCYHCTDSTGCVELGCSDCINDGYCRFLGYDCLRPPIDSGGYVTSNVDPDPVTGVVSSEIRPGVYTTQFIDDTSVTHVFDSTNFSYYQTGGFADFDYGGMFDCTHGFDMVEITIQENLAYLLQETGFNLLLESGGKIQLEDNT